MTDLNLFDIIENGIKAARETIETCRLIETRMVDHYVLALPEDGAVLHKTGLHAFRVSLGDVERTRDRAKIEDFRQHLIAVNPGNKTVQRLEIMGWKKAARLQRAVAEDILAHFEKLKKAP